jgi:hypothetical protein
VGEGLDFGLVTEGEDGIIDFGSLANWSKIC